MKGMRGFWKVAGVDNEKQWSVIRGQFRERERRVRGVPGGRRCVYVIDLRDVYWGVTSERATILSVPSKLLCLGFLIRFSRDTFALRIRSIRSHPQSLRGFYGSTKVVPLRETVSATSSRSQPSLLCLRLFLQGNDYFAGLGVVQLFAGLALNGLGIGLEPIYLPAHLRVFLL